MTDSINVELQCSLCILGTCSDITCSIHVNAEINVLSAEVVLLETLRGFVWLSIR